METKSADPSGGRATDLCAFVIVPKHLSKFFLILVEQVTYW